MYTKHTWGTLCNKGGPKTRYVPQVSKEQDIYKKSSMCGSIWWHDGGGGDCVGQCLRSQVNVSEVLEVL